MVRSHIHKAPHRAEFSPSGRGERSQKPVGGQSLLSVPVGRKSEDLMAEMSSRTFLSFLKEVKNPVALGIVVVAFFGWLMFTEPSRASDPQQTVEVKIDEQFRERWDQQFAANRSTYSMLVRLDQRMVAQEQLFAEHQFKNHHDTDGSPEKLIGLEVALMEVNRRLERIEQKIDSK